MTTTAPLRARERPGRLIARAGSVRAVPGASGASTRALRSEPGACGPQSAHESGVGPRGRSAPVEPLSAPLVTSWGPSRPGAPVRFEGDTLAEAILPPHLTRLLHLLAGPRGRGWIATELGVPIPVLACETTRLYRALGVTSRPGAVRRGIECGLLPEPGGTR